MPLDATSAAYVRMTPSPRAVRHVSWLGKVIPRRGTAVGAAFRGLVGDGGCAVVEGGLEPDTTAVAAPITVDGAVAAVINVVGPTFRVDARAVAAAAAEAAAALARSITG